MKAMSSIVIIMVTILFSGIANAETEVKSGVVENVYTVPQNNESTGTGFTIGSSIGAVIGNTQGGLFQTIVGAIAGGIIGSIVEMTSSTESTHVDVLLDSGEHVSITQDTDEKFSAGDRVQVTIAADGSSVVRVTH